MSTRIAVIPTLRREPDHLIGMRDALLAAGVEPRFVVTGRALDERLGALGVDRVQPRDNPGFAASIHAGASGAWDWLYIINDDVTIGHDFGDVVAGLDALDPASHVLEFIDPEPARRIPTLGGVFTSVALLDAVLHRLGRGGALAPAADEPWYKSFSFVAVSRGLWDALGGLDTRLPYTYEDADFTARAHALGADVRATPGSTAEHDGSSTSRRFIGRVLPVGTYSAVQYLRSRGHRRAAARTVVSAALLVRLALVPLNSAAKGDHVRAIGRSLRAVWGATPPRLPAYQES